MRILLTILAVIALVSILFFTVTPSTLAAESVGPEAIRARLRGLAQEGAEFGQPASLPGLAGRIVRAALVLVGVIFFALMVYGGSMYLTAGGNEEQVKKSRSVLVRATIGLFIVIFAGSITQFIVGRVARPVVPEASPECIDTSLFGSCPEGYRYRLDAPDEYENAPGANLSGAVCCRAAQ